MWDDETAILKNQTIRQLWPIWGPLSPPPETPVAGRPLANLSLAVNYAAGDIAPFGYHLWNLGVVLLSALLLFGIVRRTLGHPRLSSRYGGSSAGIALFSALWWLLHPLLTETVGYVTQRTESMMGLCLLLTLYASIRAAGPAHRGLWSLAAVAACFAGMATKESMVVAPIIVVWYDLAFGHGALKDRLQGRSRLYAALASSWILLALFVAGTERTTVGLGTSVGVGTYALNQLESIAGYAVRTAWPRALVLDYGVPRALTLGDVAGPAALVAVLLAVTAVTIYWRPRLGFAFGCACLALAPTSSIIPIASEVAAERRMYLPLAALAPCVAVAGWWAFERAARLGGWAKTLVVLLGVAWLAALAGGTVARNAEYKDPLTLWRSSVERRPHGRARLSYAIDLIAAGRQDEAIAQLQVAIADYPRARYALGVELSIKGDLDGATTQLLEFVAASPSAPDRIPARRLLGRLMVSKNRPEASIEQFEAILAQSPSDADARASLGDLYASLGRFQDAEAQYRALVGARPSNPEGYMRLGLVLVGSGRAEQAVPAFERAAELAPGNPDPHVRLAEVLLQMQQPDRSVEHARQALAIAPSDAAHNVAGAALASQGRLDEAIEHFRAAVQIAPSNARALENLSRAERISALRQR